MARDEIESAFAEWWTGNPTDTDRCGTLKECFGACFRAGAEWMATRAVAECRKPQDYAMPIPCPEGKPGCLVIHTVPATRPRTAEEIANALASLSPAPPRPETKRGEG